jgi:hypothetical protein
MNYWKFKGPKKNEGVQANSVEQTIPVCASFYTSLLTILCISSERVRFLILSIVSQ